MEKESNNAPKRVLICVRATQPWMTEGTVFDKLCSQCGMRVMVSRSGQYTLETVEGVEIVCDTCILPMIAEHDDVTFTPAGRPGQVREDFKNVRVNTWKERN